MVQTGALQDLSTGSLAQIRPEVVVCVHFVTQKTDHNGPLEFGSNSLDAILSELRTFFFHIITKHLSTSSFTCDSRISFR